MSKLYQKYFFGKQNLKFFEAGANDGITQSINRYYMINQRVLFTTVLLNK